MLIDFYHLLMFFLHITKFISKIIIKYKFIFD